jgi:hypothetical protein
MLPAPPLPSTSLQCHRRSANSVGRLVRPSIDPQLSPEATWSSRATPHPASKTTSHPRTWSPALHASLRSLRFSLPSIHQVPRLPSLSLCKLNRPLFAFAWCFLSFLWHPLSATSTTSSPSTTSADPIAQTTAVYHRPAPSPRARIPPRTSH